MKTRQIGAWLGGVFCEIVVAILIFRFGLEVAQFVNGESVWLRVVGLLLLLQSSLGWFIASAKLLDWATEA